MSAPRRLLAQRQEIQRRQEAVRAQHVQAMKEDRLYRFAAESEKRNFDRHCEPGAQHRSAAEERAEQQERALAAEKERRQAVEQDRLRQLRLEQERHEAEERARMEEFSQAKIRQVVRESSQEIRDLERLIKNAYVGKERVVQLKEAAAARQRAKLVELQYDEQLRQQMEKSEREEERREAEQEIERRVYGAELEKQIEAVDARKHEEYRRFLEEKKCIDELVQKIIDEDEREAQQKISKQQETKLFIESALQQRLQWKEQERRRIEEEDAKIAEYSALQEGRQAELRKKSAQQEQAREALYNELAVKMERKVKEQQELDEMIIELDMEEGLEKHRQEQAKLLEKRIKQRLEMIEAHRLQTIDQQRKVERVQAEEAAYRRMMAEQMAEQDRLDQLSAQKKRMKQAEHRRIIDELVADRNRRRVEERRVEIDQANGRDAIGKWRRDIIEQERQRILRENAVNLLGYLPKGIFRDAKDLDLFDEEFRQKIMASNATRDDDETDSEFSITAGNDGKQ